MTIQDMKIGEELAKMEARDSQLKMPFNMFLLNSEYFYNQTTNPIESRRSHSF